MKWGIFIATSLYTRHRSERLAGGRRKRETEKRRNLPYIKGQSQTAPKTHNSQLIIINYNYNYFEISKPLRHYGTFWLTPIRTYKSRTMYYDSMVKIEA